jgi:hypothetical protein
MAEGPPELHQRLKANLPGDEVYIDEFNIIHGMNIQEVYADFIHQDQADQAIRLSGIPRKIPNLPDQEEEGRIIIHSSVCLQATIPGNATAGMYKCDTVMVFTYAGKVIPLDDNNAIEWILWVLVESDAPPKFVV